ncbi:2OG-Fe(II) oxygenase, partial [Cribrihabitans sp. XS_ASV171]
MSSPLQIDATTLLTPGDSAPSFIQRSVSNPRYSFDSAAGRYLVLCFFGSAADPQGQAALQAAYGRADIFNDDRACFFGVSVDPKDEETGRIRNRIPGYRHFWDFDLTASRRYGVAARDADPAKGPVALARQWVV